MSLFAPHDLYYLAVIGLVRLNEAIRSRAFTRALVMHALGSLAFYLSSRKKRQIQTNVYRVFGRACSDAKITKIVRGSFNDFWREMLSWSTCAEPCRAHAAVEITGITHLTGGLADGKGVILWDSNGFGRRLWAKKILNREGFAIVQVHGQNNLGGFLTDAPAASRVRRRRVKPFFDGREREFVAAQIDLPASDSLVFTRTMLDCLNENGILCAAGDGRVGQKQISIGFLGYDTPFSTGLVSLARMTGAVILPVFCFQQNENIQLKICAPFPIPMAQERMEAQRATLEAYAELLQAHILQFPEQYRNWHLVATT